MTSVTSPAASSGSTPPHEETLHEEGALARRVTAGPALYFHTWLPAKTEPRAVVALLHGFADYGGRYDHVARAWVARGIGVVGVDLRGHGRSQGARGACDRFDEYLDDVTELVELLRERGRGKPAFLFGHSFGGLVATAEVLRDATRWRGLILTAPNFGVAVEVPLAKRLAGRLASRILPQFGLPSGLSGKDLTHDAAIARAYDADPLVFKNARARWFTEMLSAQERVTAGAGALSLPLYIAMGTADPVADFSVAKTFFQAAGSKDKTWDEREGLFHEILNEAPWPDIASRIATWALARV